MTATLPAPAGHAPALRAYQARTFRALVHGIETAPGETFTVMFPRQAGKNEVAATLVSYLLRANCHAGGSVVVCAPSFRPQARISIERTWRTLQQTDHLVPPIARARREGGRIACGNASALFLSASPHAHVAGHTASLALIADEAQEIDREWFDRQFRPMTASTGAATVLFGTPWDGQSLFEQQVRMNRERDAQPAAGPQLHHETGWREVARSLPAYGRYVRQERARLGERHPAYLSQYELVAGHASGRLLSPGRLAAMEGAHPRLHAPRPGERYAAGLDFGGEGERADATVLTIARLAGRRVEVVEHAAWQGQPYTRVLREAAALIRRWRPERIAADATGLGSALASRLQEEFGLRILPLTFSAALKSALGFGLIAAAETGSLLLYSDDGSPEATTLRQQLRDCRADRLPGGRLTWGDPRANDDYAVSLALCLHAAEGLGEERVAVGRGRG